MANYYDDSFKNCRWCGLAYRRFKPIGKDGFCCAAHKQAHHRAYKKYVTATLNQADSRLPRSKKPR